MPSTKKEREGEALFNCREVEVVNHHFLRLGLAVYVNLNLQVILKYDWNMSPCFSHSVRQYNERSLR